MECLDLEKCIQGFTETHSGIYWNTSRDLLKHVQLGIYWNTSRDLLKHIQGFTETHPGIY